MQQYDYLIKAIVVVLVPLIPAVIMFKAFPESKVQGSGPFAGMEWKLGGAFGGYILVLLILLGAMKINDEPPADEVWTVRGQLLADKPISPNLLKVSTMPTDFNVSGDGTFDFKLVGRRKGQQLRFPRLVFDHACLAVRTVGLDGDPGTFGDIVKPVAPIKVTPNPDTKEIVVETPIRLERLQEGCAG